MRAVSTCSALDPIELSNSDEPSRYGTDEPSKLLTALLPDPPSCEPHGAPSCLVPWPRRQNLRRQQPTPLVLEAGIARRRRDHIQDRRLRRVGGAGFSVLDWMDRALVPTPGKATSGTEPVGFFLPGLPAGHQEAPGQSGIIALHPLPHAAQRAIHRHKQRLARSWKFRSGGSGKPTSLR